MLQNHGHPDKGVPVWFARNSTAREAVRHLWFCPLTRLSKVIQILRKHRYGAIRIDIDDLREQVEQCRSDLVWSELSLAAKIRVLIRERLAQMEAEK